MARITFTDRLYRNVEADDLGYRTLRSLKVGDYVKMSSTYVGATDWFQVTEISELQPAHYSRGKYRRVQVETVRYGWDDNGAHRPTTRYETVMVFTTNDSIHIARPVN